VHIVRFANYGTDFDFQKMILVPQLKKFDQTALEEQFGAKLVVRVFGSFTTRTLSPMFIG
jgi:hypothetical protein